MTDLVGGSHSLSVRVYYEDTDFSGIVYHASYLRFCERGRTEYLRSLGIDQGALFERPEAERRSFAVRSMTCEFLKPARVDEVLKVNTVVAAMRGASLIMEQTVARENDHIFTAAVRIACLDAKGRPAKLPPELNSALKPAVTSG